MNPLIDYLLPTLFIILPLILIYKYQVALLNKDRVNKYSFTLERIFYKRYLISSDIIAELTVKSLFEDAVILELISLRSSSMEIEDVIGKLNIEEKISKTYRGIILQLELTDGIKENSSLQRFISQWKKLDRKFEDKKLMPSSFSIMNQDNSVLA